jgi:hypothetical protein
LFCETHSTPKFENNFQFYPLKDFKEHLGFLKKLLKSQQFKVSSLTNALILKKYMAMDQN